MLWYLPKTSASRRAAAGILATVLVWVGAARALTPEEIAVYSGPDRAKILLEGAKKEGAVSLYTGMIVNQAVRPVLDAFGAKYPDIKAEYWRGDSAILLQKYFTEVRAGNVQADVVESGNVAGPLQEVGASIPFRSPSAEGYSSGYVDPKNQWVATRVSYFGTAYNTKTVPDAQAPKTYDDLLDPKWKGRMSWRAGNDSGAPLFILNVLLKYGDKAGEDYLKKLSAQQVVNYTNSARALVDAVGRGEYDLSLNIFAHHPLISKKVGAPLDVRMMDPIPSNINTIHLVKGVKHPHAAMLLIDFMLSKEGQTVLLEADYQPAHPSVDLDPTLQKILPRVAKMGENVITPEMMFARTQGLNDLFEKYFK